MHIHAYVTIKCSCIHIYTQIQIQSNMGFKYIHAIILFYDQSNEMTIHTHTPHLPPPPPQDGVS